MKILKLSLLAITLTISACATNEFDAQIAQAEASIEIQKEKSYTKSIASANKSKVLWEIKGEVICSKQQKLTGNCGVVAYNPSSNSVAPEREDSTADVINAVGDGIIGTAQAFMPWMLAAEAVKLADSVGRSAGGNTTNNDSYNAHTEANVSSAETVSGTKVTGNYDSSTTDNNSMNNSNNTDNNSMNDSNNSSTTDNNSSNDDNSIDDNSDNSATNVVPTEPVIVP